MEYEFIDILPGFLSLIYITISIIVALKITSKYFEYKIKTMLYVGVSWIGLAMPWVTDAINTILILSMNTVLNPYAKVIIELAFLPYFLTTWLAGFTELMYKKKQKQVVFLCIAFGIIFDITLIVLMFTNFSLIATMSSAVAVDYSIYIILYLVCFMLIFLMTGIKFGLETAKSDKSDIKLKGKFILAAFVSFTIGAFVDIVSPIHIVWILISRGMLISSSIEYYFGFILPEKFKQYVSKDA